MKTIGFVKSDKENEKRRVLLPQDIDKIMSPKHLFFEEGYGIVLGIEDAKYIDKGCSVVSKKEALNKDIIVDPKIGDALYLNSIPDGKTIFGWVHAMQNRVLTADLLKKKMNVIAWENMFYKGQHVFSYNNELAGIASVMNAYLLYGKLPSETKAAVIGNGNTARGALYVLNALGADIDVYNSKNIALLEERLCSYDVVVNCVLWNPMRKDHIISKKDLSRTKKLGMIIDISCDRNGAIESCVPTTIENPIYYERGILYYAVDHTPSLFYKTFSINCSSLVAHYINDLVEENENQVLTDATIIGDGKIYDNNIIEFQKR